MAPLPVHPPIAPISVPPPRVPAAAASMAFTSTSSTGGGGEAEYEVSDDHRAARECHEHAVQELLQRRHAYAMVVPTNGSAMRARLRRLGEPITLFGEREMERRDSLRALMVRLKADGQVDRLLRAQEDDQAARIDDEEEIEYPFFTEGLQELLKARVNIVRYSLPRAKARIEMATRTPMRIQRRRPNSSSSRLGSSCSSAARLEVIARSLAVPSLMMHQCSPQVLLLGTRVAASVAAISHGLETKAWLILACRSAVAGNLTLIGFAANMIVCEQARQAQFLGCV